MVSAFALHDDTPTEDHIVSLHGVSWADYERIDAIRGEKSVPRLTYLDGWLEIMSPSPNHEEIKSNIAQLLAVYCVDNGIRFTAFGSWTVKNKRRRVGAEADECYVFGPDKKASRPHLAIEVTWTSGGIEKLDVYARLGVQEVWGIRSGRAPALVRSARSRVDTARANSLLAGRASGARGEKGHIKPYALRGERYVAIKKSAFLPELDLALLAKHLDHPTTYDAIVAYRAALQKKPRRSRRP